MGESTNPRCHAPFRDVYGWSFTVLPSPRTLGCWPVASWMMHWD